MAFMLLLATIIVCVLLHHHPYLVSFEMISILSSVTFFDTTKQQHKAVSCEWMSSSICSGVYEDILLKCR